MSIIVTTHTKVDMCRACPHVSNSSQEHDDPFSSPSSKVYWYCNEGKHTRNDVYISSSFEISKDCPLKK